MPNDSHKSNRRKKQFRYKEERDALERGLSDILGLLQQLVWLFAIVAIVLLAMFLGSVALIMMS